MARLTDLPPTCTGASDCLASQHVHGCYADRGDCDNPSDHGRRLQDVEAERLAEVCASCGREQHRTPGADCDTPDWHAWPEPPEPALQGADLVRFLNNDREALQQQVAYATQLLTVLAQRAGGRLTVTMQELDAVEGMALQVWRNEAADALEYEVRS